MFVLKALVLSTALLACSGQGYAPTTTPVPILKQINKQNDDGSYSYGYEAADGSFKIETKYPNGDVAGKYGYVDESGKTREISYGASSQRGFEPQGSGINVPPPTLYDPTSSNALTEGQEDDGQYREDPKIYEDPKYNRGQKQSSSFRQFHQPAQPEPQRYQEPQYQTQQVQPAARFQQRQPASTQNLHSGQYTQQTNLFSQAPQQFSQAPQQFNQAPQQFNQAPQQFPQEFRGQSQVFHQQPQFSYQAYTPQPQYQPQNYQSQNYQQNYQGQNFNPFVGHPAQNFDPNTGSYSINFTG